MRALAEGVLAGVALVLFGILYATVIEWTGPDLHARMISEQKQQLELLDGPLALILLMACVVAPLGEELFFRGALQPSVGLLVASLLFGLAHLLPSWPLVLWSLFAALAGLLFGLLYEATGSLVAPVVAHVLVNALNLRWLVRRYGPGLRN